MSQLIESNGLRFTVPDGWSVRITPPGDNGAGEYWGLNVKGGSLAVPLDDTSTFGTTMMGALGPLDVGFTLNESRPDNGSGVVPGQGIWAGGKPGAVGGEHFDPARLQVTRSGQMGLQQSFTVRGRPMDFYIVLGSAAAARKLGAFNQMVKSLQVASSVNATDYQ